jgi:PAS domain S-box-containing protein
MNTIPTHLNLLYVEDDPLVRKLSLLLLTKFFTNIITANNGEEGFKKFQKYRIDLVITDLNMPKSNGINMIKKIRKVDEDIPIFITSAYNKPEYLLKGIDLGVQGYFLKPLTKAQLSSTIQQLRKKINLLNYKKKITHLQTEYQEIMDHCNIVSKTDLYGVITYVNDEFCKVSGYSREELIGKNHNIIRCPDEPKAVFKDLWETIKKKKQTWQGVIKNHTKNGEIYYVKSTIKPILTKNGEIKEFIASRTLITDIIHPKKQLTDFLSVTNEAIVVLIKIENFNYIETPLTDKIRNQVQKEFAKKLFNWLPQKYNFSKVYILEKGKFACARKLDISKEELQNLIHDLKSFQQQINSEKINIAPIDYNLSIIMSVCYGENAFENATLGLKSLYETKQEFILANKLLEKNRDIAIKTIETFKLVQKAIDSYNIVAFFQPIINNKTQKVEKYESLVRIIDENKNVLSPALFLETAKEGNFYHKITSRVLDNSFKALYDTDKDISINLSALDMEEEETLQHFFNLLITHSREANRVVIELLEDEEIHDIEHIKRFIQQVKPYGVKIAIDDFGAGYSNFKRLLEYQPDFIKIDGSLIKNIVQDDFSRHMVEAIVAFAQKEQIKTIAEFVEDEKIFNMVHDLGIDYSQGYYFGKPKLL